MTPTFRKLHLVLGLLAGTAVAVLGLGIAGVIPGALAVALFCGVLPTAATILAADMVRST